MLMDSETLKNQAIIKTYVLLIFCLSESSIAIPQRVSKRDKWIHDWRKHDYPQMLDYVQKVHHCIDQGN